MPDFIVELMSPTDRLSRARTKMDEWIHAGVALGWLIDPERQVVEVYRPGLPAEILQGVTELEADGPVNGFTLDLKRVWEGV